jgi:hypothetical protein
MLTGRSRMHGGYGTDHEGLKVSRRFAAPGPFTASTHTAPSRNDTRRVRVPRADYSLIRSINSTRHEELRIEQGPLRCGLVTHKPPSYRLRTPRTHCVQILTSGRKFARAPLFIVMARVLLSTRPPAGAVAPLERLAPRPEWRSGIFRFASLVW